MAIEFKQSLKQSQQLMMSPQVQQAIKILALGRLELEEYIVEELRENPCLEELEEGDTPTEIPLSDDASRDDTPLDLGELRSLLKESSNVSSLSDSDSVQNETPLYELAQKNDLDLHDELARQVQLMDLESEEYDAAMLLLEYLDDNGFLGCDLEEISNNHSIDIELLKSALAAVQKCEPIGVGARNVQECLLLQISNAKKAPPLAEQILRDFWLEFEKQDVQKIARQSKNPVEKVKAAFQYIRDRLDPRPARQFGTAPNQIVIPDVFIFKRGGQWVVSLNEDGLPRLKVSKRYANLLDTKKNDDPKARDFVNNRMKSASWIINAIAERNKTILRVAEVVLKKQIDFFEKGREHLRPLTLKQIADELGLHESTISRSTSNKYMHSPLGIFELKFFFNAGMSSSGGQELANEVIRNWVGEIIKAETPGKALSDQEIADLIDKDKKVKIARRTVAKYREALGILPSSKRNAKF